MTLVLVEGFPGSGKSTTAQWLASQWTRQGRRCRWFYEQVPDHPVSRPLGTGGDRSWDAWCEDRLGHWRAFAADLVAAPLTILESALLQHSVLSMLRRDVDADTIVDYVQHIADTIRGCSPRLIYLRVPDPEAAYRAILARRGADALRQVLPGYTGLPFAERTGLTGLDLLLAYWRAHHALLERAVPVLGLPTLVVDEGRGDWTVWRREIAAFLDLAPVPDPEPPATDLERRIGRYRVRVQWNGDVRECSVALVGGRLVLDGLLWPDNPLLWKAGDVFDAESWPYEVVFEAPVGDERWLTLRRALPADSAGHGSCEC
jgi:hypothetical protein